MLTKSESSSESNETTVSRPIHTPPNYTSHEAERIRDFYSLDKIDDATYHNDVLNNPEKYIIQHLEEIVSIGYSFPSYLKHAQLALYINHFKIKTLIETGTFNGDCCHFFRNRLERIYTIDIDRWCYTNALNKFKDYPNITPILGDSAQRMPEVLNEIQEQSLFFLDGHYTYSDINGYNNLRSDIGETPIIYELASISKHFIKNHVIIIDDCGCFANSDHKDYPSVEEMKSICQQLFPNHAFITKYGSIYVTPEEVLLYRK